MVAKRKQDTADFVQQSWALADSLKPKPGETFSLRSKTTGETYEMLVLPEGYVVHQDYGCAGEVFNGPLGCWHSKTGRKPDMTTQTQALVRTEGVLTPAPIAFNQTQLDLIKTTIAKGATDAELSLFVATCTRTGLDPFLKQIYAIKRYDSKERKEVMAIQVGIDGQRLIADRTGRYAGMDPVEFLDGDGVWSEVWTGEGLPVAARTAVYRKDFARKVPATCRFESYVQTYTRNDQQYLMPNWEKMPDVMLGKCAESLALRRAFPAEMSALASIAGFDPAAEMDVLQPDGNELDRAYMERDAEDGVIEGEVVGREDTTQAPARPAARPTRPTPAQRPPTPPARPAPQREGKAPDAMTTFWMEVRSLKYDTDFVLSESQRHYDNKEPAQLTPQERTDLVQLLREAREQNAEAPKAEAVEPEAHEVLPTYSADGQAVCGVCNAPWDEQTGEHVAVQPSLSGAS